MASSSIIQKTGSSAHVSNNALKFVILGAICCAVPLVALICMWFERRKPDYAGADNEEGQTAEAVFEAVKWLDPLDDAARRRAVLSIAVLLDLDPSFGRCPDRSGHWVSVSTEPPSGERQEPRDCS